MNGPWVEQLNKQIDQLRRTELRVIVLDADGKPVQRAAVRIEQMRHAFPLGFVLGDGGFEAIPGAVSGTGLPVMFNAVSLERLTDWSKLQSTPLDEPDYSKVNAALEAARQRGFMVRWGAMISADAARNPKWLALMDKPQMAAALENHVLDVMRHFGRCVDAFDLYTHSLDHHWLTDQLGDAMVRRLFDLAQAAAPRAALAVRVENCLNEARLRQAIQHAQTLRGKFITFSQVAIEQRVGGVLMQRQLEHGLDLLGQLGGDVVIGPLEVGGSSSQAAADNLETLMRILFACDSVHGIYFSGLSVDDMADPNAALIDNAGHLTAAGMMVDGLFHKEWWTDETHATDELGNVYAKPFAGTYHISATLPDGTQLQTTVYLSKTLPADLPQHIVLLEPVKKSKH